MAKRFLSSLKLLNLSSDPENGSTGEMFYSSSENLIKYHNGSSWVSLAPYEQDVDGGNAGSTFVYFLDGGFAQ